MTMSRQNKQGQDTESTIVGQNVRNYTKRTIYKYLVQNTYINIWGRMGWIEVNRWKSYLLQKLILGGNVVEDKIRSIWEMNLLDHLYA